MKKFLRAPFYLMVAYNLFSCSTIISQVQTQNKVPTDTYPPAVALDQKIVEKPPVIDLSQYKSVHSRFKNKSNMAIAMATSGGGYRAANLTVGVMIGLEKLYNPTSKRNLLESVDYFSSVSGSGIAVGYYLDQLYLHQLTRPSVPFSLEQSTNQFKKNPNNPLRDDLSKYLFFGKNRGLALEATLNQSLFASLHELTLGDIYISKNSSKPVRLPYWATNSMIYQNAAIFPFAPDILQRYKIVGYSHGNQAYKLTNAYDFPVSVGVTASTSLPVITPPTTLISNGCAEQCYLHLVDGGLTDSLGVFTALNFLLQDKSKIKVLIIVDASKSTLQPYSQSPDSPKTISLMTRLIAANGDANREHIRPNIDFIAKKLLGANSKKIVVIYLDLDRYPKARLISTKLAISAEDQQFLIDLGKQLVMQNPQIKQLLRV